MQIAIQTSGFALTEGLRAHVERRIRFAFDWARLQVGRVAVRLSDLNGPRGGEDKRCHIQASLAGAPDIVIDDTQSDLYVAIDRAADRAGRSLARRMQRLSDRRNGNVRQSRKLRTPSTEALPQPSVVEEAIESRDPHEPISFH